jgi:hypothetical protein
MAMARRRTGGAALSQLSEGEREERERFYVWLVKLYMCGL